MTHKHTLPEALLSPQCYPHSTDRIRLIETHISWVLLTGEFAYKLKKPVNFGFLDFSTLARRKYCCEEEVRLNSRFSKDLYLEVVAITRDGEKLAVGAEGEVVEYAVKMREFSQHHLLESLAAQNGLVDDDAGALAKTLADFHLHKAARLDPGDASLGSVESITGAAIENFKQIEPHLKNDASREALSKLRVWTEKQGEALHEVFAQRRADGFVRECHGDLHLRNIARINGAMVFFDCIEFNPQLSWIDIQSELAFLLMDMEDRRLHALSNRVLNTWLEYTGDYQGLAVLNFYKVYRAMVRAKVMVLKLDGGEVQPEEEDKLWREYDAYIELAQSYCADTKPFLALMHGVSGTGKSTVAATLAGQCGGIRVRSDVERKRLFGLSPDERSDGEAKQSIYSKDASLKTFAALESLADGLLALGYPVFVDATFIATKWRQLFFRLAGKHEVTVVIIECRASPEEIARRLDHREATQHDASEAGVAVMRKQLEGVEPFSAEEQRHVRTIDTEKPIDANVLNNI